jgi:beta-glucosidase
LRTKFKLGMFDPFEESKWAKLGLDIVDGPEHRELARRAARESIVLLKNKDAVLPLPRNPDRLLVVGPTATSFGALLGNYHGVSPQMVTIFQGILEATEPNTPVKYRPGCPLLSPQAPGVNYTFGASEAADFVIAVMGLDHTLEGEEGDTVASPSGGDRDKIELPDVQMNFLRELRQHSKKLILVLTGCSAMAVSEALEICDAVVLAWYPGCEGGHGVADVLFGAASPSGRLPISFARKTEDLPAFNDYNMKGRTYRFAEKEQLFPFGFGLTYGRTSYENIALSTDKIGAGGSVTVSASVRNTGSTTVDEVVQLYIIPPRDWPEAPNATLRGFDKVRIEPGKSAKVSFTLPAKAFMQTDASGHEILHPGKYGIVVGSCSPGKRGIELGAPVPVEATVTVA